MAKPSGQVYLCKNAVIDKTYQHTIDFKSPDEQFAYWGSLIKYTITDFMYIRRQNQYLKIDKPLHELEDVNYLFFHSADDLKLYFCFVTSKEYVSDNVTYVYFETDVLQTYMFDYQVKQSYVLQEHCDRWDANHNPIYSRTEENLDYGSEYTVESAFRVRSQFDLHWYLAICTAGHEVSSGRNSTEPTKIGGVANPYIYYLLPALPKVQTEMFTFAYEGGSIVCGGIQQFTKIMADSELGSFVKHIIKLPYNPFDITVIKHDLGYTFQSGGSSDSILDYSVLNYDSNLHGFIRIVRAPIQEQKTLAEMDIFEGIDSALPTADQWAKVKAQPYNVERDKRFESKLLTHPYRYNLLHDWKGQPITIKNEYISGSKIKLNYIQSASFNGAARYWLEGYKKDPEGRNSSVIQLTQEDSPIINDIYYEYMLQNKNQIEANKSNAITSTVASIGQSLLGGAIFGGGLGAVQGAIGGAISGSVNYANMVRSENAKQKDLKNLPDSIISSNDSTFNIQDNNLYLTLYRMKICCEFEELLADTFAMTGYTVKRVKVPNLKSRLRFNYVKTVGANIVGSINQQDLTTIKQIFDNGVTFWHYNTVNFKPFDYSLENIETKLL